MVQTWPALRTAYGQTLDAVSSVTVEAPPLEGESSAEKRFNELLADLLLSRRVGIAMADGMRSGFGEVLAQAFTSYAFGFSVLVPYWQGREEGEARGALESDGVLVVEPVAQSSVNRWEPDLEANDYKGLRYYTSNGLLQRNNYLERDRFILFAHRAIPGQYYGDGELRALVPLYHLLASVRRQQYQINQRSAGIVVAREGMGSGNENRANLESQLERFGDGEPWVVVPHGAEFAVQFPSGSPPNLIEQIREIDAQALQMWASQMDVLGVSQTGSRAVADAMEAKSARVNANRIAPFVARVYERLGRWIAEAEGYRGRIREAVPVGLQEVDRGARVELLAKAVTGGLMQWTREDELRLREELDLQLDEEPADPAALSLLAKRPGPKSAAQTPAEPSERVKGSDKNPKGSAGSTRGGIEISEEQEEALRNQIEDYRERYPDAPAPNLGMLKAVYRRGAGAFSGSHRPGMSRAQWALARTKRFLTMLRGGRVKDSYRKADGDLLPDDHPAKLALSQILTVYAGPPCSGKSETALRGEHGALIDVDDLLNELGGFYSASASRQAHALALQDLDDAIERGVPSIGVVAPLLSSKMRDEYAGRAAAAGYASRLVYLTADLPVLESRNRRRSSRRLRMAALRAMAGEPPAEAAAFDTFEVLDTSARPPQGVRDAARNGIERHRAGETGDGIEPSTIAAARRLAKGDVIGEEQLRKGGRFWARNERFLDSEPGSAAWASAQLWGGRAGMTWYRSQVERLDREAKAALSSCGCGACDASGTELAAEPAGGIIQTATGSMPHYRDGLELTIRGVKVYPESWTTLETEAERRAEADSMFDESLDEVIAEVTDDLEEAAEDSPKALDAVEEEARVKVADAIEAYFLDVRAAASKARQVEREMQADTAVSGPGIALADDDAKQGPVGFSLDRIRTAAEAAARKIVGDIRGRLERFLATTGSARGFRASPSAKRGKAYTIDAKPVANAIEAQGGELKPPRPGMVLVGGTRTSAKDAKVCPTCRAEDGRTFLFPEELAEFEAYRQLPDPLCSSAAKTGGRSLCRCKWIYVWGFDK